MEKKTKHRLLGMLVVVALVLISLPLFQGGKETGTSVSLIKAPPFPDQTVQVSTAATESKVPAIQESPIPLHDPSHANDSGGINQLPDDTISSNSPTAVTVKPAEPSIVAPDSEAKKPVPNDANLESNAVAKPVPLTQPAPKEEDGSESPEGTDYIFKNNTQTTVTPDSAGKMKKTKELDLTKPHPLKMHQTLKGKKSPFEGNGLLKLKNAVWVIQVGSFKSKENALRLVNKLRMNGYRAFIQQASIYTQVFVGPEPKQNSARVLKRQLELDLHISGIIVSYKPLTL